MKNLTLSISRICLLSLFVTLFSCSSIAQKGSGNVIKKNVDVSNFDGIKIGGAYEVYLRQGDKEEVTIVADDNIMENIIVYVKDGELRIKHEQDIKNPTELKAYITVKYLKSIDISGACELEGKNTIVSKELTINASGASDLELAVRCTGLILETSGASELEISGDTKSLGIEASGASTIEAEDLTSEMAMVKGSGASTIKVFASGTLGAKASGASTIHYTCTGEVTINESGAGSIKKR